MDKKLIILIILLLTILTSGCQEEKTENNIIPDNIKLESDVVDLIFADFIEHKDREKTNRIEVQFLFKNIVNRIIDIKVYVEFYDKEDNLLNTSYSKEGTYPPGYYDEILNPLWSTILYDGDDADKVEYVKIVVKEYWLSKIFIFYFLK